LYGDIKIAFIPVMSLEYRKIDEQLCQACTAT
jgi:hypothetical protein